MNCKYIKENNLHEEYLLDKLNKSEKEDYLNHLTNCKSCQNDQSIEKEVIASIRMLGKSEMKAEITKQVDAIRTEKKDISWDMILKVAAIFFFIVITPGLVFYYYSFYTPKDAEQLTYDESWQPQKELKADEAIDVEKITDNESEKAENTSSKELINLAEGDQRYAAVPEDKKSTTENAKRREKLQKDVKKPNTAYVKNLSGGAAPSNHQPITFSNSKPSKKLRVKDAESIDDLLSASEEIDGLQETILKKQRVEIPKTGKFIKPNYFQATGHKYFKAKKIAGQAEYTSGPPKLYSIPQSQNKIRTDTGIDQEELKPDQIYQLRYNLNDSTIALNLVPFYEKSQFYSQQSFPDSFPVNKTIQKYYDLTLDFFINEKIRNLDPAGIKIALTKSKLLFVNFDQTSFYKIELHSDSTKAILIEH